MFVFGVTLTRFPSAKANTDKCVVCHGGTLTQIKMDDMTAPKKLGLDNVYRYDTSALEVTLCDCGQMIKIRDFA